MDYLRFSYSSMNVFSSCNRKFELQKLYPQRDRGEDMFAADVGTALHKGYQNYLITQDENQAIWAYLEAYPYELEQRESNDYRSCEAGRSTLIEMLESVQMADYELAMIKNPEGLIVPAIEVPFEIRFKGITLPDGRGIAFTGFMDAVMRNLITGSFRTTDIKTHRRSLNDATAKYKFDSQQTPYGIAIEHIQGNPVDDFEVLYLDCYVDILEPRVTLYPFSRTSEDVQEWLTNKVLEFKSIQRYMEMGFFPRTDGGCLFYNKPCRFLEPCTSRERETIEMWLLMGEEPKAPRLDQPWIVGEIDVFGGES